jgi:hypothetical protein
VGCKPQWRADGLRRWDSQARRDLGVAHYLEVLTMKSAQFILFATMALFAGVSFANPIPLPVPASMPLEEMTITVGLDKHVTFTGDFTFDYIPGGVCGALPCVAVTEMQFPLPPVNASSVAVFQDGIPLPWAMSADT